MASGAPCFFGDEGDDPADRDSSVAVAGDRACGAAIDPDGVSGGSGDGEVFFFRCGEPLAAGAGAIVFFFGLAPGNSHSSSVVDAFLLFAEGVTDGADDPFLRAGDNSFFGAGLGEGVGDFFFVVDALFFFRGFGVGVGVGVEKIFLMASPNDCSARTGASWEIMIRRRMRRRSDMDSGWTKRGDIS